MRLNCARRSGWGGRGGASSAGRGENRSSTLLEPQLTGSGDRLAARGDTQLVVDRDRLRRSGPTPPAGLNRAPELLARRRDIGSSRAGWPACARSRTAGRGQSVRRAASYHIPMYPRCPRAVPALFRRDRGAC